MSDVPKWPQQSGSSLLLVLTEPSSHLSAELSHELDRIASGFGAEVGQGADLCTDLVRGGVRSLPWLDPASVFVFRCPRELPVWEAAPLLELGLGTMPDHLVMAGTQLLQSCAEAALARAARVAFVAAHEWREGDAVRFESGELHDFLSFIASPTAWTTEYLGHGNKYLVNVNSEFPFWYEVRASGRS